MGPIYLKQLPIREWHRDNAIHDDDPFHPKSKRRRNLPRHKMRKRIRLTLPNLWFWFWFPPKLFPFLPTRRIAYEFQSLVSFQVFCDRVLRIRKFSEPKLLILRRTTSLTLGIPATSSSFLVLLFAISIIQFLRFFSATGHLRSLLAKKLNSHPQTQFLNWEAEWFCCTCFTRPPPSRAHS